MPRQISILWTGAIGMSVWTLLGTAATPLLAQGPVTTVQQFHLSIPGEPRLNSTATFSETALVITDASGRSFRYERTPAFDTPDGRYWGFFSPAAQQALRWPVSGRGTMQVGDAQGTTWRESLQQVQPVPAAGQPLGGPIIRPAPPPRGAEAVAATRTAPPAQLPPLAHSPPGGAIHVALGSDRRSRPRLGMIDSGGVVRLFESTSAGWKYLAELSGLNLVPGAPLGMAPDVTPRLVRVYTIDATGTLIQLTSGQGSIPIAPQTSFVPGGGLTVTASERGTFAVAVDASGQLWNLDLLPQEPLHPRHEVLNRIPGLLLPGSPVTEVDSPLSERGRMRELFVTSARGVLLRYQQTLGGWSSAEPLAEGFLPGAPVAAIYYRSPNGIVSLCLAAVDWRGQLQFLSGVPGNLHAEIIDRGTLPPGAWVLMHSSVEGLLVTAVGVDGGWRVWRPSGPDSAWEATLVQTGFPPGAPVHADPVSGGLLCVDVRGRVVGAVHRLDHWECTLCHHDIPLPPKLVSRRVIPSAPLPPVRVTFTNGGPEELVVQLADAADPNRSREIALPPGGAESVVLERDGGAMIEEVSLIPGPAGDWLQHVEQYPLPPQPRYSLAVWAQRTTYSYIDDRKHRPAGALPSFDIQSHISLGVVQLPGGELLRGGETIDLYREAARNRNPGAAVWFGPPQAPPAFVPRE
jgi:hypothetical protein